MKRARSASLSLILIVPLAAIVVPGHAAPASILRARVSVRRHAGERLVAAPAAGSVRDCVEGVNCESFPMDVDVAEGLYRTEARVMDVTIEWSDPTADLDLYMCRGNTRSGRVCSNDLVGSSAQSHTRSETVHIRNPRTGTYTAFVAAVSGVSDYDADVAMRTAGDEPIIPTADSHSGKFSWHARAVSFLSNFGEPSIDVDHSGGIYVTAPGGAGVQMWRSFDGGQTFDYKEIGSPNGGGDSEIEFNLKDVGFTADLEVFDSAMSRSTDKFETFEQQPVGQEQDRQWIAHRCTKDIYLAYHDFVVEAELMNVSHDAGQTWSPTPIPIGNPGEAPGNQDTPIITDQGVNTFSGPAVVDQKTGDMYVIYAISTAEGNVTTGIPPFGEPSQIIVATSHDKGETFELHLVQGGEVGSLAGEIFPWITVDKAGNVYASYAYRKDETKTLNIALTYSTDHGDTWSKPYIVNKDKTGASHIYSTMSAGDPGVVDIAWYTSSTPDPGSADNDWFLDFAQIRKAATQNPKISQSRVFKESLHHGEVCLLGTLCATGGDRSLLDFFQVQVGEDGMANIAFVSNDYPDQQQRVWYAGQTEGRSAGNGLHDTQFCSKKGGGGNQLPGPGVRLNLSDRTPSRGERVTFHSHLRKCTGNDGTKLELQRRKGKNWKTIDTKKLNGRCRTNFRQTADYSSRMYRTLWPKQNDSYRQGHSKPRTVETH